MRVALFPGQGVPARTVLSALPPGDQLVEKASEVLCFDLRKRVEQAARRERSAMPTSLAQPAIFTASLLSWRDCTDKGFRALAGHSLGEYAALVAGRAMTFEHALCVVQVRGRAMEAAASATNGGMVAVIGLPLDEVDAIASASGVQIANDNAPRQIVISGDEDALVGAASEVRNRGGRAVKLEVTGAFHTPQVATAAKQLQDALEHISIRMPSVQVISNVSAAPYRAPGEIRRLLVEQLTTRVRFRESMELLWRNGVRDFHDLGPGQVVAGLAKHTFGSLDREPAAVSA